MYKTHKNIGGGLAVDQRLTIAIVPLFRTYRGLQAWFGDPDSDLYSIRIATMDSGVRPFRCERSIADRECKTGELCEDPDRYVVVDRPNRPAWSADFESKYSAINKQYHLRQARYRYL